MGVNIFAPVPNAGFADGIVRLANNKAKGRFDWCDKFEGPGGWFLSLEDALAFDNGSAPVWVLLNGKMFTVKGREHWQQLLRNSGCQHVIFLKARL